MCVGGEAVGVRTAGKGALWAALAWLLVAGLYLGLKLRFDPEHPVQKLLLDRHPLGLVRLGYVGLQLVVLGLASLGWWDVLAGRWPVRMLALLGQHSLSVFICSIFLDYLFKQAIQTWQVGFPQNLFFPAVEVLLVYLSARALNRCRSA